MRDRGFGICMAAGCSQRATDKPGGVALCEPHIAAVMQALTPAPVEIPIMKVYSIIYYLMFDADPSRIKIGTSTSPAKRFKALSARHGPYKLIACSPGHIREEKIVHARFRDLRVSSRGELFEYRGRLIEHVRRVKRENPGWQELPGQVALEARFGFPQPA